MYKKKIIMAKENWIDCRCNTNIKNYSVAKWKELTGWPLSRVYAVFTSGKNPINLYDQHVIAAARSVLGYLRKMAPIAHHSDRYHKAYITLISKYRDALNKEIDDLSQGQPPVYIEAEVVKRIEKYHKKVRFKYMHTFTLQAALRETEFMDWNPDSLAVVCKKLIDAYIQAEQIANVREEKFNSIRWWWQVGGIPYNSRINIRVNIEARHTGKSDHIRGLLLLPYDLPSGADPNRAANLEKDLDILKNFYTTWRKPKKDVWRKARESATWTEIQSKALAVEECGEFHQLIERLSSVRPILDNLKEDQVRLLRQELPDED